MAPRFGSPPNEEDQARLQREREKAAQVSRDARVTPRIWTSNVVMPRNARVTSEFGTGREFNGQISSRHMGLDLAGARGDTVGGGSRRDRPRSSTASCWRATSCT